MAEMEERFEIENYIFPSICVWVYAVYMLCPSVHFSASNHPLQVREREGEISKNVCPCTYKCRERECTHEKHTNMKMDIRMSDDDAVYMRGRLGEEGERDEIVRCWPFHFSPRVMSILWVAY